MEASDDPVQRQYEDYPYPPRDPADERRRLVTGSPSLLDEVSHYVFNGGLDVTRGFRALVAGGGTGDAAIMLAQHLADAGGGEVVYLDMSRASRRVAEERAAVRGLANISFYTGSLLDLPDMGLGPFDYIDCCGVLHHLPDPPAGLRALRAVLNDGGGMGLMLYATYGRRGVYEMQDMLRTLTAGKPAAEKVRLARHLLERLPETNLLRRNTVLSDYKRSDHELYDLLLHARDRPYTVPELADYLDGAGLRPAAFIEPLRYNPDAYLGEAMFREPLGELDFVARAAFAEKLAGNMRKHIVYAVPQARGETIARPQPTAVPVPHDFDPPGMARGMKGRTGAGITVDFDGIKLRFPLPPLAEPILARIDGSRAIGDIVAEMMRADTSLDRARIRADFAALYGVFNGINKLFLRVPAGREV